MDESAPTGSVPANDTAPDSQPEALAKSKVPEAIEVYVCPNCGSWYGSSSMPQLETTHNTRSSLRNLATEDPSQWGSSTGTRAVCQHCKAQSKDVERIKVTFYGPGAIIRALDRAIEEAFQSEEKASGVKLSRPS